MKTAILSLNIKAHSQCESLASSLQTGTITVRELLIQQNNNKEPAGQKLAGFVL